MAFSSLQRSILYTLAYSHQWQWPLMVTELQRRLLARVAPEIDDHFEFHQQPVSMEEVTRAVNQLETQGLVSVSEEKLLSLSGFEDTVHNRVTREEIARTKWQEVFVFLTKVKRLPWIEGVFVTGALAVNNVHQDDDVDFMIVTAPGTLWLTRLLVSWVAFLAGKRRTWNGFEPNSWCFNLWLTSDDLGVFATRKSLYTAYELLQMKCVYDKGGVEARLRHQNAWVAEFLPQWSRNALPKDLQQAHELVAPPRWLALLNRVVYYLQSWYMRSHQTREVVSVTHAFFHPRDTQSLVYQGWASVLQSWSRVLGSKSSL